MKDYSSKLFTLGVLYHTGFIILLLGNSMGLTHSPGWAAFGGLFLFVMGVIFSAGSIAKEKERSR